MSRLDNTMIEIIAQSDYPIELSEVKRHLFVEHDDDDEYITACIADAVSYCESGTQRSLREITYRDTLCYFPLNYEFPNPPFQYLTKIEYFDSTNTLRQVDVSQITTLRSDRQAGSYHVMQRPAVYNRRDAVRIEWIAGPYTTGNIHRAILLMCYHYFENRSSEITGTIVSKFSASADALLLKERYYA